MILDVKKVNRVCVSSFTQTQIMIERVVIVDRWIKTTCYVSFQSFFYTRWGANRPDIADESAVESIAILAERSSRWDVSHDVRNERLCGE